MIRFVLHDEHDLVGAVAGLMRIQGPRQSLLQCLKREVGMKTIFALLLFLSASAASAAEVSGVKVDDTARVGGAELVLNGAGLRTKVFFKVYVAGLYLGAKKTSTAEVLALAGPKRVSMRLMRELSAQQLVEALEEGLRDNTPATEQEAIKARTVELAATMLAVQTAKEGDIVALDFIPASGTQVLLNGQPRGKPIAGEDFYRALLRIWLGDKPVSADLKKALLGEGA